LHRGLQNGIEADFSESKGLLQIEQRIVAI